MNERELTEVYHRYLRCLNERRWDDLGEFVSDDAIHNERPLGLDGYRAMLKGDVAAIPDLLFSAEVVIAQGDKLASRLMFRCTPQRQFLGFEPSGAQISFAEHVLYRFHDAKIAEVWSIIDTQAITAQSAR